MSELLSWFGRRREVKALKLMEDHLANVVSAVEDLERALDAALRGDEADVAACVRRVAEAEMEADRLRRAIMDELASEVVPVIGREDLMHLVKRMDMIADWSREATRILETIPLPEVPKEILEECLKMAKGAKECAYAVRRAIDKLLTKPDEALREADTVERLEEQVDALYKEARMVFASLKPGCPSVPVLILLRDLMNAIENVADWCENTCDQIRVICVVLK
ncbi:MAG TPA: DUF47 family protein [Candidatus Bathyarchaeota archaeon]|nr:DUF47 family protein [Candidatus Bathyarchaeota archaeon]